MDKAGGERAIVPSLERDNSGIPNQGAIVPGQIQGDRSGEHKNQRMGERSTPTHRKAAPPSRFVAGLLPIAFESEGYASKELSLLLKVWSKSWAPSRSWS